MFFTISLQQVHFFFFFFITNTNDTDNFLFFLLLEEKTWTSIPKNIHSFPLCWLLFAILI